MALIKPNYYFYKGFVYYEPRLNFKRKDNGVITINYLLSSKCQLNCGYCIAKDIIEKYNMPSLEQINKAIDTILELDPLVVVLTGGEPLLSPYLEYVIERLYNNIHIILDTNGLLLLNSDLEFLRERYVTIRISADTLDEKNSIVRPHKSNTPYNIYDVLKHMEKIDYPYVISTVISNYNYEQLPFYGRAYSMWPFVMGWRLQKIIPCHNIDLSSYMINPETGSSTDFDEKIMETLSAIKYIRDKNLSLNEFTMHVCLEERKNSAIMILPDSSIAISNKTNETREVVTLDELRGKIKNDNHAYRYVLK